MEQYDKRKFYKQVLSVSANREGKVIQDIHRGEIYYYQFTGTEIGHEMKTVDGVIDRRPCVVVSNDKANAFSNLVTIVPMTSKDKKPLPTHVLYDGRKCVQGTFLCEQVCTISNERLLSFCEEVDDKTMKKIDAGLCIQLAISASDSVPPVPREDTNTRALKEELDFYKRSYFELIDRLAGRNA